MTATWTPLPEEDAKAIAAQLSYEQQEALFGRFAWAGLMEQEDGERELYRLGLWGPHGGRSELANAVRAEILAARRATP